MVLHARRYTYKINHPRPGVGNCFRLRAALRPWKLIESRIWMLNLFAGRKLRYFSPQIVVIPKKKGLFFYLI